MHTVGNDPYWIQLGHTWHARLDLHLVLANMRVLFGLVTTWPNYAGHHSSGYHHWLSGCYHRLPGCRYPIAKVPSSAVRMPLILQHQGRKGSSYEMCWSWRSSISTHGSSRLPHGGHQLSWFMTMIWGDCEINRTMVTLETEGCLDRFRPSGG
jgi:hypothetical protein